MTVTFKPLKYKHKDQASELLKRIKADEIEPREVHLFIMSLVASWDYIDPETNLPVPVGDLDELTIDQFNDCQDEFNRQMQEGTEVKKTNDSKPSSGSGPSKKTKGKSQKTRASYLADPTG